MKNNRLDAEQTLAFIGSVPDIKEGIVFKGIEWRDTLKGDVFYSSANKWEKAIHPSHARYHVAIFEDTHRTDGTPMEIEPLPVVEGCRVEFFGKRLTSDTMGDACGFLYNSKHSDGWVNSDGDVNPIGTTSSGYYARLFKIANPTKLSDLFEGGSCWVRQSNQSPPQLVTSINGGNIKFEGEYFNFIYLSDIGARWSNNPLTPYSEANKFNS